MAENTTKKSEEEYTKGLEDDLADLETYIEDISSSVPHPIYMANPNGIIIDMNKALEGLTGFGQEEMLGKLSYHLFREKEEARNLEKETLEKGVSKSQELTLLTKDKEIPVILNLSARKDIGGKVIGYAATITDITELNAKTNALEKTMIELDKSRKELERTYEELKTLDKMKADFLEMAAHELRTPIVAIKIYMDLIVNEKLGRINKKQKKKIGIVSKNIEQLTKIINEMIDVSRIESGKLDIRKRYISIPEFVKMIVDDVKPMADKKGQTIVMEMPASLPDIPGDVDLVFRAFMNLLSNAIKYTLKNGIITVKAYDEERNIHITVQDNGVGIPEEELEKIFDKFYIGSSSEHKGIGLGLAIVKGIVEQHNGKIWAESKVGKYSTFHVLLPKNGGKT